MGKLIKSTKKTATALLATLALAVGLVFVAPTVGAVATDCSSTLTLKSGASCVRGTGQASSLFGTEGILTKIINTVLFAVGLISVVMLIYGGVRYTVSGGAADAVKNAKNTILYAIVGVVISLLAYAIVNWVVGALVSTT